MVERVRGRALQQRRRRYFDLHPLCEMCRDNGRTQAATQLDHIKPLVQGGSDDPGNWQGLCAECHKAKTATDFGHAKRIGCDAAGQPLDTTHPWWTDPR